MSITQKDSEQQTLIDNAAKAIEEGFKVNKTEKPAIENVIKQDEEIKLLADSAGVGLNEGMALRIRGDMKTRTGAFDDKSGPLRKNPYYKELGNALKGKDDKAKETESSQPPGEAGETSSASSQEESEKNPNQTTEKDQKNPKQEQEGKETTEKQNETENSNKTKGGNLEKENATKTAAKEAQAVKNATAEAGQAGWKALSRAAGQALKQGGAWVARVLVTAGWPVLAIAAIIIVVLFIAVFLMTGKESHFTANAAGDSGQIQANLAASKVETLKKSLDENVDVFIAQIERIKSLTAGKNKEAIKIQCDKIIQSAKDLKAQPAVGSSESSGGGPGSAGIKERAKAQIMDAVRAMISLFDVVDIAMMETGVCEGWYNFSQKPYSRKGNAWCAAFVQAVYKQAGLQIPPTDLAPCLYAKMKEEDPDKYFTFEAGKGTPQPGDIVFFHWEDQGLIDSADYCHIQDVEHVGIVKEVKSANEIITIEGNTSGADGSRGCVAEKPRNIQPAYGKSGARYFGRVK